MRERLNAYEREERVPVMKYDSGLQRYETRLDTLSGRATGVSGENPII